MLSQPQGFLCTHSNVFTIHIYTKPANCTGLCCMSPLDTLGACVILHNIRTWVCHITHWDLTRRNFKTHDSRRHILGLKYSSMLWVSKDLAAHEKRVILWCNRLELVADIKLISDTPQASPFSCNRCSHYWLCVSASLSPNYLTRLDILCAFWFCIISSCHESAVYRKHCHADALFVQYT